MNSPKILSVVIPAYNEEATLADVVSRVLAVQHLHEIVIVDDCSRDRTGIIADELAREHGAIKVAHHPENRGKTEALKTGFALTSGEIVIVQDADLEYDPCEIEEVYRAYLGGPRRCRLRLAFSGAQSRPRSLFLSLHGEPGIDVPFEPFHQREYDGCRKGDIRRLGVTLFAT